MTLQNEIDVMKNYISGEPKSETQTGKTVDGHVRLTDEFSNTSASDKKTGVNIDVDGVDEQTFVSTDNSDKVVKIFSKSFCRCYHDKLGNDKCGCF